LIWHERSFLKVAGEEHYKLLAYISLCFEEEIIYDIGTDYGTLLHLPFAKTPILYPTTLLI